MTADDDLKTTLGRWELRLGLAESLVWGPWGAAVGVALGLLLALAARLWPLLAARQVAGVAGLLALVGMVLGPVAVWLRPRSLVSSARVFDRCFGLAERLVTAVEIAAGQLQAAPQMAAAQLTDTLQAVSLVDLRAKLPLRLSPRALLTLGMLAVALSLSLWLPNPQEDVLLQQAAVRAAIEEQVEALEAVREKVAEADGLDEAEREALLQVLDEAIAAMDEGRATPLEAMAALSEAEQALLDVQDSQAAMAQAALESVAEEMAGSKHLRDVAEALANGEYQRAAEALAAYAGEEGEALTAEAMLELAPERARAAEAVAESDPKLAAELARAAEAIERGDLEEAREAIREAAGRMGEAGEQVEQQAAVEGALSQLQEGREEIAQAASGEQPGQGEPGGQVGAQGDDEQQPGSGQQTTPGHHEDAGSGEPYGEVYVPDRLDEEGQGMDVGREGGEGMPTGDTPLPVPEGGTANVPYRQVYAAYADRASAALEGSYIPLGLKQYVRDYFTSLEP